MNYYEFHEKGACPDHPEAAEPQMYSLYKAKVQAPRSVLFNLPLSPSMSSSFQRTFELLSVTKLGVDKGQAQGMG